MLTPNALICRFLVKQAACFTALSVIPDSDGTCEAVQKGTNRKLKQTYVAALESTSHKTRT